MEAPIGVAVIGGGVFVKEEHLPAVLACKPLSLKAIYSRSLKSATNAANLIPAEHAHVKPDLYSADSGPGKSYSDLLNRKDIKAVIIALPIARQTEFTLKALRAGKHVLAEKPTAKDVETAKALIRDAEEIRAQNGATLSIAENFRFLPYSDYIVEQAEKLGGPVLHFLVRIMMMADEKYYMTEWRKDPEFQGGFLLDGGVHFAAITLLLLLVGGEASLPVKVHAFTQQIQEHLRPIDTVNAIIKLRGGGTGAYQFSMGSQSQVWEWEFGFQGGVLNIVNNTVTVTPRGGKAVVKEFEPSSGVKEEVAAWAKSLVEGKPDPRLSPVKATNDVELLEKMFRSAEEDGAIKQYEFM